MESQLTYWVGLSSVYQKISYCYDEVWCLTLLSLLIMVSDLFRCRCQHCRPLRLISSVTPSVTNILGVRFKRQSRHEFTWNIQIHSPDAWLNLHRRTFLPFVANLCWMAKELCCCAVPGGRRNPFNALRKTTLLKLCHGLSFFLHSQGAATGKVP